MEELEEEEDDDHLSLEGRVHRYARDGLAITLYAILTSGEQLPERRVEILSRSVTDDKTGQTTTPLIIAARNGHEKAVKIITKFAPDLGQTGTVKFGAYVIEGEFITERADDDSLLTIVI